LRGQTTASFLPNVWESGEARSAWHNNQLHREAVLASGMPTLMQERLVREYVTGQVELFHKQLDDRSDLVDYRPHVFRPSQRSRRRSPSEVPVFAEQQQSPAPFGGPLTWARSGSVSASRRLGLGTPFVAKPIGVGPPRAAKGIA
jgi:hypothetical protein